MGAGHSQHWALGQLWPSQHHTVAGITALPRWETEARKQPGRTADEVRALSQPRSHSRVSSPPRPCTSALDQTCGGVGVCG